VTTEGFLVYLKEEDFALLVTDLNVQKIFRWWIIDILSPGLLNFLKKRSFRQFTEGKRTDALCTEKAEGVLL
jgi:hypothetical protein